MVLKAYRFENDHDCVIAYRGTEITEWNDVKADIKATLAVVGAFGRVHSGFNREVDDIWPLLQEILKENTKKLWFCGHSLGGAISTICAFRCWQDPLIPDPVELHTFGSPRVGDKRFVKHTEGQTFPLGPQ
jgi:triacylglycerol lipase